MPTKNSIKIYVENSYYHVYNRGVERREIFMDNQDYNVFLRNLKESLSPPPDPITLVKEFNTFKGPTFKGIPRQPNNFYYEIELVAYCLMPNHFHLLIKQNSKTSMESFMRSLATRYSMYFNDRNNRAGTLFQGKYKASMICTDSYLLHLSRYIHQNPYNLTNDLTKWYSSYSDYVGRTNTTWIKPKIILDQFKESSPDFQNSTTYKDFVKNSEIDSASMLGDLLLE